MVQIDSREIVVVVLVDFVVVFAVNVVVVNPKNLPIKFRQQLRYC